MEAKLLETYGSWESVYASALTTVGLESKGTTPSNSWKKSMLLSEHSPIRGLMFRVVLIDVPYWVSVHLVRHKIGIEHFVRTQRTDRTGVDRNDLPQGSLVNHEMLFNAQTAITMSRKRLCKMASKETIEAWKLVLEALKWEDDVLYSVCVPECVYRGFCPERKTCGFAMSEKFRQQRAKYIEK